MLAAVCAIAVSLVGGLLPFVPRVSAGTSGITADFSPRGALAIGLCAEGEDYREYRTNGNGDADEQALEQLDPPYRDLHPLEDSHEWVLSLCVDWDGTYSTAPGGSPVQQLRGESIAAEGALLDQAMSSTFGAPKVWTTPEVAGQTEAGRPYYVGLETWIKVDEDDWNRKAPTPGGSEGADVTVHTTPKAVLWTFGTSSGRCEDTPGELAPEGIGADFSDAAPCGFVPQEWAEAVGFTVRVEYEVTATGTLTGETRTSTIVSDPYEAERRVDEVQAFGVDPSGEVEAPPPADRDYDDGRDCGLNPLSWGDCARDAVDWAVDKISAGVELLWDLARGCGEAVADKFGEVVGIATEAWELVTDPVGWIEEKVGSVRQAIEAAMEDLDGAALEALKGFIEWDLLMSDPVKWVGKVGCTFLIEAFTGTLATKFTSWLDDIVHRSKNRDGNNNDSDNNDNDNNNGSNDQRSIDDPNSRAGQENFDGDTSPLCRDSFPTGTRVRLADGNHRAIEAVRPGDQVLAYDATSRSWSARAVLAQWSHLDTDAMVRVGLADGSGVVATDHHPFWVDDQGGWVEAEDLEPGHLLLTPDGVVEVSSIDKWNTTGTLVWELDVEIDNNFVVSTGTADVLVHNQECLIPGTDAHRDARWEEYLARPESERKWGPEDREKWDNVYDANQDRARAANQRMNDVAGELDMPDREHPINAEDLPGDFDSGRRIDIADVENKIGIEHKMGEVTYLTESNRLEILKDAALRSEAGWDMTWVLDGRASQPLRDFLAENGIALVENYGQ